MRGFGAGIEVQTGWEEAIASLKLKIQLYCSDEIAMGPGKAELLRQIAAQGSISAAARAMGMSYRRAWMLVDAMNRCFREPLVAARPGRAGARVTEQGASLLAAYRRLSDHLQVQANHEALEVLQAAVLERPRPG